MMIQKNLPNTVNTVRAGITIPESYTWMSESYMLHSSFGWNLWKPSIDSWTPQALGKVFMKETHLYIYILIRSYMYMYLIFNHIYIMQIRHR